jgi:hypothetical protein
LDGQKTDEFGDLDPGSTRQLRLMGTAAYGAGSITLEGYRYHPDSTNDWMSSFIQPIDWGWYSEVSPITIPKVTLLVILVSFIILAGPINILYLAPPERRLRLFITVPAIALTTGLLLFLGIIFAEGFGGAGKRFLVLYSLPALHSEAVWQEEVSKTHVLITSDWQNTDRALVSKHAAPSPYYNQQQISSNLNQAGSLMTGDWYSNRAVQMLYLRAVRPSRSELILKPGQKLQSCFPVDLKEVHLCYCGNYYCCKDLHVGEVKSYVMEPEARFYSFVDTAFLHSDIAIKPRRSDCDRYYAVPETVPDSLPLHSLSSIHWDATEAVYAGQFDDQSGANP